MNYEKLLNRTVQEIPPSGIRKFFDIVSTMKDAISLGVGEPDFVTPWNICESAIYSIEQGQTHYSSNWGNLNLRREISDYLHTRCGIDYNPNNEIIVTVGASEGIDLALRTMLEPGDEVLIPDPSYVSYSPCVHLSGGVPVGIPTSADHGFKLLPEQLRACITPRTKALILPYPNNPTGGIMERADLEALAEVLKDTDILVISDEIYSELTYGGRKHVSFASIPGMFERTVTLNGFSKAFAMTGWRLGYALGPAEVIRQMTKLHQFGIMSAPTTAQFGAVEAMKNGDIDIENMRCEYDMRRRMIVERLRTMGLDCFEPEGAFYVFPSIQSTGYSSEEFCTQLLQKEHVAVVPGSAFGASGEGFVRISYSYSMKHLTDAMERIERFLHEKR